MAFKSYAEKLRDPRWQRKRLEALGYYEFQCQECANTTKELHVHHMQYKKGLNPWDYSVADLVVLCSLCHKKLHDAKDNLNNLIGEVTSAEQLDRIAGYVAAVSTDAFSVHVDNKDKQFGYSDFYRMPPKAVEWMVNKNIGKTCPIHRNIPPHFWVVGED